MTTEAPYTCSFCGKPKDQVQRLIAGPESMYICNECLSLCQEILDTPKPDPDQNIISLPESPHSCSFCDKPQDQVQRLIAGPGNTYICDECIGLHRKRIENEGVIFPLLHPSQDTSSLPQSPYSCSFCGKSQDQVQRLVAGPGGFFICGECTDLHRKTLEDKYAAPTPNPDQNTNSQSEISNPNATPKTLYSCSFCDKQQDQVQWLIAGPEGVFICGECVELCMGII